jgi:hypothetical protein
MAADSRPAAVRSRREAGHKLGAPPYEDSATPAPVAAAAVVLVSTRRRRSENEEAGYGKRHGGRRHDQPAAPAPPRGGQSDGENGHRVRRPTR